VIFVLTILSRDDHTASDAWASPTIPSKPDFSISRYEFPSFGKALFEINKRVLDLIVNKQTGRWMIMKKKGNIFMKKGAF
jgi:hypothetical protein